MRLAARALLEGVGTALLVGIGCGAIVIDGATGGLGTWGIAFAFFVAVALPVWLVGPASGAHLNPAVTLALASRGRFAWSEVGPYLCAQAVGASTAALALHIVAPRGSALGATTFAAGVSPVTGFVLEAVATAALVVVILLMATGRAFSRLTRALAIGATVGLAAGTIGPLTGAALNPARSLGPALVASALDPVLWIYLVAPSVGAVLGAALVCRFAPPAWCCAEELVPVPRLPS